MMGDHFSSAFEAFVISGIGRILWWLGRGGLFFEIDVKTNQKRYLLQKNHNFLADLW